MCCGGILLLLLLLLLPFSAHMHTRARTHTHNPSSSQSSIYPHFPYTAPPLKSDIPQQSQQLKSPQSSPTPYITSSSHAHPTPFHHRHHHENVNHWQSSLLLLHTHSFGCLLLVCGDDPCGRDTSQSLSLTGEGSYTLGLGN